MVEYKLQMYVCLQQGCQGRWNAGTLNENDTLSRDTGRRRVKHDQRHQTHCTKKQCKQDSSISDLYVGIVYFIKLARSWSEYFCRVCVVFELCYRAHLRATPPRLTQIHLPTNFLWYAPTFIAAQQPFGWHSFAVSSKMWKLDTKATT